MEFANSDSFYANAGLPSFRMISVTFNQNTVFYFTQIYCKCLRNAGHILHGLDVFT